MDVSNKFYRSFLIFSQEDMGFGNNGIPSGYVKIESMEGKGKLHVSVQNLKENREGYDYKVYILKCDDKLVYPVCAGIIPYQRNKGELQWDFNPLNVANTGIAIENFNVAAVLVEKNDSPNNKVICPMAAYKDKKVQWKDKLNEIKNSMQPKLEDDEGDIIKKHEVFSKYDKTFESKYTKADFLSNTNLPEVEKFHIKENENIAGNVHMPPENTPVKIQEEEVFENKEELLEVKNENEELKALANMDGNEAESILEQEEQDGLKVPGFSNGHVNIEELEIGNPVISETAQNPVQSGMAPNPGTCAYVNTSFCNPQMYGNIANGCANCSAKNFIKEDLSQTKVVGDKKASPNMEKFRKNLDVYFEISDPFKSNRRDYKWWKVNNPVQLNNVFYQCNIKTPLFFNPSVMMAHYKYRYLIVGIYSDKTRGREYIVCGIPGVHGIDDKPFGDMCRWVQVEGNRPRYGAYGYWLVYIDPNTGRFLTLN